MSRILALLSCVVAAAAATCATSDNANCANWVNNGFCDGKYTLAQIQQYCPNSCKKSGCGANAAAAATTTTLAENKNCKSWAENAKSPFCASNDVKPAQKSTFCKNTCKAEITPDGDCAIYTAKKDVLTRVPGVKKDATKPVEIKLADADTTVSRAYVAEKCTLYLFADVPTTITLTDAKQKLEGAKDKNYLEVTVADAQKAKSYVCACT